MKNIADGLSRVFNVDIDLTYSRLPGAVVNDAHLTQEAIEVAKNVGYHVSMLDEPVTIGEDFSGYTEEYPVFSHLLAPTVNMIYIILNIIQMSVFWKKFLNISFSSFNVY